MVCKYCASSKIKLVRGHPVCTVCKRTLDNRPKGALLAGAPRTTADIHPNKRATKPSLRPQPIAAKSAAIETKATGVRSKPVVQPSRRQSTQRGRPAPRSATILASSLTGGFSAGLVSLMIFTALHISHATSPGGFFHFLATRSSHTKTLLVVLVPAALLALSFIVLLWLWRQATAGYAASRFYDHRPITPRQARTAGANALGSLAALSFVSMVISGLWLAGLILAIKATSTLSLVYWQVAAIGIGVCFVMVLVGLWIVAVEHLSALAVVLGGEGYWRALATGFRLTSKRYVAVAAKTLWLTLYLGVAVGLSLATFLGLSMSRFGLSTWVRALIGSATTVVIFSLLNWYHMRQWLWCYRNSISQVETGTKAARLLIGRSPTKINRLGAILSLGWWLLVAGISSWLIWHYRVDPSSIFNRLAATIY